MLLIENIWLKAADDLYYSILMIYNEYRFAQYY